MNLHLPRNHFNFRDPKWVAGLSLLVIANVVHYLVPRLGIRPTDSLDFVQGTLTGAAIGLLLWSLITTSRPRTQA
ncbi:MAG: hypothetical protein ACJ73D_02290 [Pyrinomonadaceae bacterium]